MVPFIVLKTREEALTGLLWEKVGEEGAFGFVLVEFYLGKAAVLQGPVPTSQLSPWSPVLGRIRHPAREPSCICCARSDHCTRWRASLSSHALRTHAQ